MIDLAWRQSNLRALAAMPALGVFVTAMLLAGAVHGAGQDDDDETAIKRSGPVRPAEDPTGPRRHFRVRDPARITDAQAEDLYAGLKAEMARRYARSRAPGAVRYQGWTRYNNAPYRSAAHGRRLVNNYANRAARAYGRFEKAGRLPVGAIIAKDSIAVSANGDINAGPLFLMEKMPVGFKFSSGDWRYTMIMPDGSLFGTTNGEGSDKVKFCVPCHLAAEKNDHLFFLPGKYRTR